MQAFSATITEIIPLKSCNGPCKGIRIPESGKFCACGIRNPALWNPEYSCRNPKSWALESGIQPKESEIPLTIEIQNPSSTDKNWNPVILESEIQIHSVRWGREERRREGKWREGKEREEKGREERRREGKGREKKGMEGKGREWKAVSTSFIKNEVKEMTIKN